ncbi:MAG: NFACT family protein [Candidatus Woesearchaeota archaeon]
MKDEMSSLELEYIVEELKKLSDSRIDKIFSNENKDLFMQVYKAELGKPLIRVHVPRYAYIASYKPPFSHPSNFCMRLRKRLKNGIIRGVSKIKNERVIKLTIEKKDELGIVSRQHMYFEFFLKGNIILTDDADFIVALAENQIWTERTLKMKEKYIIPGKSISSLKQSLGKELVKYVAEDMGFGGELAEEICALSSIDKARSELSEAEMKTLNDVITSMTDHSRNTKGYVYTVGNQKRIYPFRMHTMAGYQKIEEYPSFNDAVDAVKSSELESSVKKVMGKGKAKALKKQERIIESQKKQLEKNDKIIEESTTKGDLIYKNYSEIQEIFDQLKEARKTMDWSEIKEKVKNRKILDIDEKNGKITLDLD